MAHRRKKEFCEMRFEDVPDCEGKCCHFCPKKHYCKDACPRQYPEECKFLISQKEFFWRKLFDTFYSRVEVNI